MKKSKNLLPMRNAKAYGECYTKAKTKTKAKRRKKETLTTTMTMNTTRTVAMPLKSLTALQDFKESDEVKEDEEDEDGAIDGKTHGRRLR